MKASANSRRRYWLWVTRREHYIDKKGKDSNKLDPSNFDGRKSWWTCHRDTRKGDLALLWRASPKCDIGYLIQVESDAFSLKDDKDAARNHWKYGCNYHSLLRFTQPITLAELRDEPYFSGWKPRKSNFRGIAFEIEPADWIKLTNMAFEKEIRGLQESLTNLKTIRSRLKRT
ncbi:MAG TPA: hypothetical protein VGK87_07435 [Anaerolineae bacterium]